MSDGSIVISTELDNKELERDLSRLKRKVEGLEEKMFKQKQGRLPMAEQARDLGAALDAAKAKLASMESGDTFFTKASVANQAEEVKRLQVEYNAVDKTLERCDNKIKETNVDLDLQKTKAGAVAQQLAAASSASNLMGDAVKRAGKSMDRFKARLKEVVRSALIFTLITQSLAKFKDWMGRVVQSNTEASAAMARLKGALLTLVQPLVGVIIPAFTTLVNILTRIITAIAQFMAMLFGGTIDGSKKAAQALNKETAALDKTGAAAEKAGKELAGFDEINKLSDKSSTGGGAVTAPSFDFDTTGAEGDFSKILNIVKLIGAALLAWKLSGSMKEFFSLSGLQKLAGAFLLLDGAIGFVQSTLDAWANGVTWETFFGMLGRSAELVGGLFLLFGKTGAAIGLIVTGITMMVTAFQDAEKNGWNLQNMLLAVAGILATGAGIALLTGSWIPLLIAGIAAALLAIVTTFGDGKKLIADAKLFLQGFLDFFIGIFTGDIEKALGGIGKIFDGLRGIVGNVLDSIKNMFFSFLDWLDEKTGGKFSGIIQFIKDLVGGTIDWFKERFMGLADSIQEIFEGIVTFLSGVFSGDWDKALEGVKGIFKGFVNGLIGLVESFVNFFVKGINAVIGAANKLSFKAPDWLGGGAFGISIPKVPELRLPRLATGAVIPPNREFMAVLGDQRHGTNIETPEGLLRQIFREESGNGAVVSELREILAAIREGKVMMVDKREIGVIVQEALSSMTRSGLSPVTVR